VDKTNIRPQFAAALGAELARLQRRVDGISQRLDGPAVARPEPDRADAGLGARVDDLARAFDQRAREAAEARERLETLHGELGGLGAAVSALRQQLAGVASPLEAHLAELAELAARMPADPAPAIDELRQGIDQLRREAHAVADRVMGLEGRLASAEIMLGAVAADGREDRLAADQEMVRRRIDDLANALETARGEAREQAERGRLAIAQQQHRLRARAGVGLTLVVLLGLTLVGALGWWTQSELRRAEGRLALLESETVAGGLSQSLPPASGPSADVADLRASYTELREHVNRLAARQGDPSTAEIRAAVGEVQVLLQRQAADAAAVLAGRLDTLDRRQAETSDRVDALADLVETQLGHPVAPETRVADPAPAVPAVLEAPPGAGPEQVLEAAEVDQAPDAVIAEPTTPGAAPSRVLTEARYVVQLIGFRSERSVGPFARRQGIAGEARYLRGRLRGQPWFEVVIGDYATEAEAQAALTRLPESLRALEPWVRGLPPGSELLTID
jgi:septal ring-binding cell division protein DamX